MAVKGSQREGFSLWTGLCDFKVVAINPTQEELADLLNVDVEKVKDPEYTGTTENGEAKLRIDVYLRNEEHNITTKVVFWTEDRESISKKGSTQFINEVGTSVWCATTPEEASNIDWFTNRAYRVALVGEADLYNFFVAWFNIDPRAADSEVVLDTPFSEVVNGNLEELKGLLDVFNQRQVRVLLGVKDGKYQDVYSKVFLPGGSTYVKRLEQVLERDAESGYPYKGDYQNSFELKKYTGESAPEETVSASSVDVASILNRK
jgi:hypothetical protein